MYAFLGFLFCFCVKLPLLWISYFVSPLLKRLGLESKVSPKDKVVVVTGCDTGFGHLASLELDRLGFSVLALCLTRDGVETLQRSASDRLVALQADVTKDADVAKAVSEAGRMAGSRGVYALINNAGVLGGFHVDFTTIKQYESVMAVNFFGVVRCTKMFLPLLQQWSPRTEDASARVVILTSAAGLVPTPLMSAYGASKHAADGFATSVRRELREVDIHVSIVNPGFFRTKMVADGISVIMGDVRKNHSSLVASRYGEAFVDYTRAQLSKAHELWDDPMCVVNYLVHATQSVRPWMRYIVGTDANILARLTYMLPDTIGDLLHRELTTAFGSNPWPQPLYRTEQGR
eukprot:Rmarinus@m.26456